MIAELQETKLTLNVYLEENQRLIQELGETKFQMLSMGGPGAEITTDQSLQEENCELRKEVASLRSELEQARKVQQKLKEKEEENKNLESGKRPGFGSFGSIGSNHRDSTGYMVIKNPSSEQRITSKASAKNSHSFYFEFLWHFLFSAQKSLILFILDLNISKQKRILASKPRCFFHSCSIQATCGPISPQTRLRK